jgi:small ligand-binding sensory domain FIST
MQMAAAGARAGLGRKLVEQVTAKVKASLAGMPADLGFLFATNHFEDELQDLAALVRQATGLGVLLGCTAEGVLGPEQEYESEPALVLWVAHLPGVTVRPFHLRPADIEHAASAEHWRRQLQVSPESEPSFLLLGDPFTVDVNALLDGINQHVPQHPVIGGMASGADRPGQSALVLGDQVYREGAVGVALAGAVEIATVVSQGCRPVGRPFVITKAERNVIHQLGGHPPLAVLQQIYEEASEADQKLMQQGIFLGRVINEQRAEFHRGDFLIRNLMGVDQESGAVAVGDLMRVGITVQFHLRDAATADEDLRALLTPQAAAPPAGALLFSCNGRGCRLFPEKDHDVRVVRELLGQPPVAGFFCAGELGPVGGKNFIHGHTASLALFRPRG